MPRPRRVVPDPPPPSLPSLPSRPKLELHVIIYDRPRYVPGRAPPQPPISLVPPRDDHGAFIVDKVVTPFDAADGDETAKRVLNYVVGWPDVPYARQLVPCTQILDYVSPRTLEDWEYALTERQRREREADEAEEAAAAAADRKPKAKIKDDGGAGAGVIATATTATSPTTTTPGGGLAAVPSLSSPHAKETNPLRPVHQRRRRGPHGRKKRFTKPKKTPGLAASTPTKAGAAHMADSSSRTPRTGGSFSGLQIQLDVAPHISSPTPSQQLSSEQLFAQSIPSLAAGKQRTGLSLTRPFQALVDLAMPDEVESSVDEAAPEDDSGLEQMDVVGENSLGLEPGDGRWAGAALVASTATTSANEGETDGEDELLQEPTAAPQRHQKYQQSHHITHIPPPAIPAPKPKPPPGPRVTPIIPPKVLGMSPKAAGSTKKKTITPIPPPIYPLHPFHPALLSTAGSGNSSRNSSGSSGSTSSLKRKRNSEEHPPAPPPPPPLTKAAAGGGGGGKEEDEDEEELYEVDCLEGDCLTLVDGKGGSSGGLGGARGPAAAATPADFKNGRVVRFFLVRWKGDWPPDQNPTWEPAENLPPRMVRQYLKKTARQQTATSAAKA